MDRIIINKKTRNTTLTIVRVIGGTLGIDPIIATTIQYSKANTRR